MRVTNSMIANRISFNTQASLGRFLNTQTQLSTGRRINKSSDDPIGTIRDMDYRDALTRNEQFQKNISQSTTWVQKYDNLLENLNDIANSAREISVTMADASITSEARMAAVSEINPLIEQLLQLSNDQQEGRYLFSGYQTDQAAFTKNANGFTFDGDGGIIKYKIDESSSIGVNLIGSDVFLEQFSILGENSDYNNILTGTTSIDELNNGSGIDMTAGSFVITDNNLGRTATINIGGSTNIDDVINNINSQLASNGITNLTAAIGAENNNIVLEGTTTNRISLATNLDQLNSGNGIDVSSGGMILTDDSGINVSIDFSSAETIGDIISTFNNTVSAAGVTNVVMQMNASSNGLEIVDVNSPALGVHLENQTVNGDIVGDLGFTTDAISPTMTGDNLDAKLSFEITENGGTTASDLGLSGEFAEIIVGSDLDPILTASSSISSLFNGMGFETEQLVVWQGEYRLDIDLSSPSMSTVQDLLDAFNNSGLDITASINAENRGIQVVNNDPSRSFTIEDAGDSGMSKRMGLYGSSDFVGSIFVLANALANDDQQGVGLLIQNFDDSINHLLNTRAEVGTRGILLETTSTRLIDQNLMYTEKLSEIEDADLTEVATLLAMYENNYQASLLASARIIQPSLLNFLQ